VLFTPMSSWLLLSSAEHPKPADAEGNVDDRVTVTVATVTVVIGATNVGDVFSSGNPAGSGVTSAACSRSRRAWTRGKPAPRCGACTGKATHTPTHKRTPGARKRVRGRVMEEDVHPEAGWGCKSPVRAAQAGTVEEGRESLAEQVRNGRRCSLGTSQGYSIESCHRGQKPQLYWMQTVAVVKPSPAVGIGCTL
jgi:hypothetical protein